MDGESIDMLKAHLVVPSFDYLFSELIQAEDCKLRELRFKKSDIDDTECAGDLLIDYSS
jgi:hypothetical protein